MTIGHMIRQGRTEHSWNRTEFANMVGASRVTVYRWEKDEMQITLPYLKKVCDILGYDSLDVIRNIMGENEVDSETEQILLAWKLADQSIKEAVRLILGIKKLS